MHAHADPSRVPPEPATAPVWLTVKPDHIPQRLRDVAHWVCWRAEFIKGQWTKVPYQAAAPKQHAAVDNPSTWASLATALDTYTRVESMDGIGYVLTADDSIAGVDLDHCRDPRTGAIARWAQAIVDRFATYTERSPSGTGLRLFMIGALPPGRRVLGKVGPRQDGKIELYDDRRYLTVTGHRLAGTPMQIEPRRDELKRWHAELFPPAPATAGRQRNGAPPDTDDRSAARSGPGGAQWPQVSTAVRPRRLAGRGLSVPERGRPGALRHALLLDRPILIVSISCFGGRRLMRPKWDRQAAPRDLRRPHDRGRLRAGGGGDDSATEAAHGSAEQGSWGSGCSRCPEIPALVWRRRQADAGRTPGRPGGGGGPRAVPRAGWRHGVRQHPRRPPSRDLGDPLDRVCSMAPVALLPEDRQTAERAAGRRRPKAPGIAGPVRPSRAGCLCPGRPRWGDRLPRSGRRRVAGGRDHAGGLPGGLRPAGSPSAGPAGCCRCPCRSRGAAWMSCATSSMSGRRRERPDLAAHRRLAGRRAPPRGSVSRAGAPWGAGHRQDDAATGPADLDRPQHRPGPRRASRGPRSRHRREE